MNDPSDHELLDELGLELSPERPIAGGEERRRRSWSQLVTDIGTLGDDLGGHLRTADADQGQVPTPCPAWSLCQLVTHLAAGDHDATMALRGEPWTHRHPDPDADIRARVDEFAPDDLMTAIACWRTQRTSLLDELRRERPPGDRVSWVTGSITALALVQSRAMETWIHGWDVCRALRRPWRLDDRAYWVSDLGMRSLSYALVRDGWPPDLRVEASLDGPAGGRWDRRLGAARPAVTLRGAGWAWVVWVSRRVPTARLQAHLSTRGPATAVERLRSARAFV